MGKQRNRELKVNRYVGAERCKCRQKEKKKDRDDSMTGIQMKTFLRRAQSCNDTERCSKRDVELEKWRNREKEKMKKLRDGERDQLTGRKTVRKHKAEEID